MAAVAYFHSFNFDNIIFRHSYDNPSKDVPFHIHDICELVYLKKGSVNYTVEGKIYPLTKNNLVISRPLKLHALTMNQPTEYERYNILFDKKILSSTIYEQISPDIDVINFDGNSLVSDLFKKMDYYCVHFEGDMLQLLLTNLTEEILFNAEFAARNFTQSNLCTVNPLINGAIEYINKNLTLPLNIDTICRELHITKSHLHNLFVKHLKTTPKQYINSKKLTLAQQQLRSGAAPTDVYINCGFSEYTAFYRGYKKLFGHAPSEEQNSELIRWVDY